MLADLGAAGVVAAADAADADIVAVLIGVLGPDAIAFVAVRSAALMGGCAASSMPVAMAIVS